MMMEQQQQQAAEESCVPPGFRFHPTEEELVGYYLARKQQVASHKMDIIQELDLYRIEPWDLQERCEQQTEWYFFSYKDRKYPSGTRTNRATAAGFWKATGRDKPVLSARSSRVIGMRKTLVFYKGRAPNGRKTDWIMHEYRLLQDNEHAPPAPQEEGWVVCRAFQKPTPNQRPCFFPSSSSSYSSYCGYDPNARLPGAVDDRYNYLQQQQQQQQPPSAGLHDDANNISFYSDDDDLLSESKTKHLFSPIPPLESPTTATAIACASQQQRTTAESELAVVIQQGGQAAAGAIDWSFLDALLSTTSQLDPRALSSTNTTFLQ